MPRKDIDKAEEVIADPSCAEEQAWLAQELSLIKEELSRIEASTQQLGGDFDFDWEDDRPKTFDRRPDEPAEGAEAFTKRTEDAVVPSHEEIRAELAALHSALRNLVYEQTTDLRTRLARAETRLAARQSHILSPAKPLRRS